MAAIFTPGLTVAPDTMIVKDRKLPIEGEVTVTKGEHVIADQIVARTQLPGKVYPINIANQLGVSASRLTAHMTKAVGDTVEEGEIIAETNGILGFFKSQATAIVSGTIENISSVSGEVIIQANPIPVEIDAYMNGTVVDVFDREGCIIQNRGTLIQGIFGLGGEVKGVLNVAVNASTEVLTPDRLTSSMIGQIVVGGAYLPAETVKRAQDIGVAGIVTGGFDYDDIKDLLGYEVGVAITGGEDLGLTIVVTEGFGNIQMAPSTFKLLQTHNMREASMNGATQIRAGVIRPEVIVTAETEGLATEQWTPPEPVGIQIGDAVRGIRTPYFGCLGRVKSLPVELSVMASETKVRTMEVEFDDGTIALIPRANVESIDG